MLGSNLIAKLNAVNIVFSDNFQTGNPTSIGCLGKAN